MWLEGWGCSRVLWLDAAGAQRRQRRVLVLLLDLACVEVAVRHPHGKQSHGERVVWLSPSGKSRAAVASKTIREDVRGRQQLA